MARKTKSERLKAVHSAALAEFDNIQSAVREEREQCLQDRRFYSIAGAQWEGALGEQFENKPKFEVNKIHLSVLRIINEYRNNRISVDFKGRNGKDDDRLADTCDGLYRADENDSAAYEAYDNAFEEAVAGGFGAWRLRTEYEDETDEDDDHQRIRIEPIFDADSSVFFDLQAKRQDKADAKKCFVLTSMTYDAYMEEWDDDPASWPKSVQQTEFDWSAPDVVYVAEYYVVEETKKLVHVWEMLDGSEKRYSAEELESEIETLEAIGAKEVKTKQVKTKRVHKYILSGGKVLEDCGYIAGQCLPIIPVYGKRWYVDNIERCMGHVRLSKDSQRLKNMQVSKLGEISALGSVEKPIVTPEQIAGHQIMWEEDNIKNHPYLLINPITDINGQEAAAPPVGYTRSATVPQALAALLQLTEEDINDLLGNTREAEQMQGGISTETATLIHGRMDMHVFIYMSNLSKAMKRNAEVWLSMAKDSYVEDDREMETLTEGGAMGAVTLNRPVLDTQGAVVYDHDLAHAKMKVVAGVQPASSTRKMATVRSLTAMLEKTQDPETRQVLGAMIMMNMEGEGIEEVRDYFRYKMIKMGVVKPTDEEREKLQQELSNAKPTPQDEYFKAAAEKEHAESVEKQANTILKQAQADETRADTAKTLTEIKRKDAELAMQAVKDLGPRVNPTSVQGSEIQGLPRGE